MFFCKRNTCIDNICLYFKRILGPRKLFSEGVETLYVPKELKLQIRNAPYGSIISLYVFLSRMPCCCSTCAFSVNMNLPRYSECESTGNLVEVLLLHVFMYLYSLFYHSFIEFFCLCFLKLQGITGSCNCLVSIMPRPVLSDWKQAAGHILYPT